MELATYIEQSFDLLKYLVSQINWSNFKPYYNYLYFGLGAFLVLFIVIKIIRRKKEKKKYIENGVVLKLSFPPMGEKLEKIINMLRSVYNLSVSQFGEKYYFAFEMFIAAERGFVCIFVPRRVLSILPENLLRHTEVITNYRKEYILQKNFSNALYLELELGKDFVYPLPSEQGNSQHFSKLDKKKNESVYLQLGLRPLKNNWKDKITEYQNDLKKGKVPSRFGGCVSGFVYITLPLFSLLGDVFTSLIHSNSKSVNQTSDEKKENTEEINSLGEKKSDIGFEFNLRVLLNSDQKERTYEIGEEILDLLSFENDDKNYFAVSKTEKKLKKSIRNDFFLSFLDPKSVDILNIKEVKAIVEKFLKNLEN